MPQRLDTRSPDFGTAFAALLASKRESAVDVDQAVQQIIADVVADGDRALIAYSKKFDRVDLTEIGLAVSAEEIAAAELAAAPEALAALRLAHERIISFHERQRPATSFSPIRLALNSAGGGVQLRLLGFTSRAEQPAIRPRY